MHAFGFKVVESASKGVAMAPLRDRDNAAKYRSLGRSVHRVAVEFSRKTRNLDGFEVASGQP